MSRVMLSAHFGLDEWSRSVEAVRLGIDNVPGAQAVINARALFVQVIEPARTNDRPWYITSGYRCEELNRAVGGQPGSQHLCRGTDAAADLVAVGSGDPGDRAWRVAWCIYRRGVPFDQLIVEHGLWVHVSHRRQTTGAKPNRGQLLVSRWDGQRKMYEPWPG